MIAKEEVCGCGTREGDGHDSAIEWLRCALDDRTRKLEWAKDQIAAYASRDRSAATPPDPAPYLGMPPVIYKHTEQGDCIALVTEVFQSGAVTLIIFPPYNAAVMRLAATRGDLPGQWRPAPKAP